MSERWPFCTPGIPDHLFLREQGVPMTKQEVRALSVAFLQLFPGAVLYDIGAGSGSVSVECALMGCGRVYAIERNARSAELIQSNLKLFDVNNVEVICGAAPPALETLPPADRIFLGGSGGDLAAILDVIDRKLKPGGRLVVNSITLHTAPAVLSHLQQGNYRDVKISSLNVSRAVTRGRTSLWQALNPVQIIAAEKGENEHVVR